MFSYYASACARLLFTWLWLKPCANGVQWMLNSTLCQVTLMIVVRSKQTKHGYFAMAREFMLDGPSRRGLKGSTSWDEKNLL